MIAIRQGMFQSTGFCLRLTDRGLITALTIPAGFYPLIVPLGLAWMKALGTAENLHRKVRLSCFWAYFHFPTPCFIHFVIGNPLVREMSLAEERRLWKRI